MVTPAQMVALAPIHTLLPMAIASEVEIACARCAGSRAWPVALMVTPGAMKVPWPILMGDVSRSVTP